MTMKGIDISHYQDGLNLAESGVDFAVLKISEGRTIADSAFEKHYANGLEAGIPLGAYVFSHAVTPAQAKAEVEFALALLKGRHLPLGIYMDVETTAQLQLTTGQLDETVRAFCEAVEAAGYVSGIYSSEYGAWSKLDPNSFGDSIVWVAHYGKEPQIPCDLWQSTDKGTLVNYSRPVDEDIPRSARFEALVRGEEEAPDPTPAPKTFPPDPSVAIIQMVMQYNGYWEKPVDGKKTPEFFETLRSFTDDMEVC